MKLKLNQIPKDHPVRPLRKGQAAKDRVTCGHCGLSWDDAIPTSLTPAPSARCPFEYFHIPEVVTFRESSGVHQRPPKRKTLLAFKQRAFAQKHIPSEMLSPRWDRYWFHVFREEWESGRRSSVRMSTIWGAIEFIAIRHGLLTEHPERPSERAMNRMDKMARSLLHAAETWEKQAEVEPSAAAVYLRDGQQLRTVHSLFVKGLLKEAWGVARQLDTIIREQIPEGVWDLLSDQEVKSN